MFNEAIFAAFLAVLLQAGTATAAGPEGAGPDQAPKETGAVPAGYTPQAASDRWRLYWKSAFLSPRPYLGAAFGAATQIWRARPREWELGAEGYARRAGALFALKGTQTALFHASAAALHEDSRFEVCHCTGTWKRIGFALSQRFVTRNRSGRLVPRYSYVGGYMAGGMIATSWYPDSYRVTGQGLVFGATGIGFGAATQILTEFGPEIKRLLRRK